VGLQDSPLALALQFLTEVDMALDDQLGLRLVDLSPFQLSCLQDKPPERVDRLGSLLFFLQDMALGQGDPQEFQLSALPGMVPALDGLLGLKLVCPQILELDKDGPLDKDGQQGPDMACLQDMEQVLVYLLVQRLFAQQGMGLVLVDLLAQVCQQVLHMVVVLGQSPGMVYQQALRLNDARELVLEHSSIQVLVQEYCFELAPARVYL
jgi:hypothetical protein